MVEIGLALVLVGAALLVVEAHVSGGVVGVFGGIPLAGGAALAIAGAGGGLGLVLAAIVGAVAVTGALAGRRRAQVAGRRPAARRLRPRGAQRAHRRGAHWTGDGGQVFVDGALWRARRSWMEDEERARRRRCRRGRARERADAGGAAGRGLGGTPLIEIVLIVVVVVALAVAALAAASVRVLREYERGVVFRLGRVIELKGPGVALLVPGVDRMVRVSLRTVTLRIPPQEVITRDNVPVRVAAVAYFRVIDPTNSVLEIEDFRAATLQIAQTTLRSVLGKAELDALLSERERLNESLQQIIDEQTEPWGIKVTIVEIKDVEIPDSMQHALARQAEAERNRRAKVINAEGEFQAAARLADAADVIRPNPVTIQLRYLQALSDISSNQASTIVFPLPLDLLRPLLEADKKATPDAVAQHASGHNGPA